MHGFGNSLVSKFDDYSGTQTDAGLIKWELEAIIWTLTFAKP